MKYVSGMAHVVDGVYLTTLVPQVGSQYTVNIKPLAVDEIFWAAFMPEEKMTARMRLNRRMNGAFLVRPMTLVSGAAVAEAADGPDWEPLLDEFERVRADFIAQHPTVEDFAEVQARLQPGHTASGTALPLTITSLMAAGRSEEAALLADEAISRGQSSGMSSTVDALQYLSAYAKGPQAYAAFTQSLIPTHSVQVISETGPSPSLDLAREHFAGTLDVTWRGWTGARRGPWCWMPARQWGQPTSEPRCAICRPRVPRRP